ncbi:UvrD-helicase domain-containing protein [Patescibacteria group bacterium]|nr:UvrD-helicase domain-containing protein [Patescibacteria group bacterium]
MQPKINLNENQQKAVQHKTGPLLVIAGAGTGKTRVITERIRHLIQNKKASPEEILALTFTDKASQEMEERVGDIMPLGYVEPWISTFHSFADRLLRAEGLEIGIDPSYKVLAYPEQWLLLRKNLFKLDLDYFRPLGNPTKFISAALKFISRLQDENITPVEYRDFVEKYKGDKEEKLRYKELLHIYEKYDELKLQNSKMDFGDLITWTIKLLKTREIILNKYKEQFKYILVDEFQDTNYAQYELVKILFPPDNTEKHSKYKNRSLLAVGDDSQSIYKFRGAAISNIMQFREDYKSADTITLLQNYRSTQNILDPAYKLIQENNPDTLEHKLGISKKLISQSVGNQVKPKAIELETHNDEVEFIIEKIYEILGTEPTYTFKDIAVLARANNHLEPVVMGLRQHGIPYQLVGNRGLYDRDEIRDIISLLKVIINPRDNINLYRILSIASLNIPYELTADILAQSKFRKVSLWELMCASNDENVSSLCGKIRKSQQEMTNITPVEFVYELVQSIKYIENFTKEENVQNQLCIKNLDIFLNRIKQFQVDYHSEQRSLPTIVDFMDYLELIIEAGENPAQAEIEDVDTVNLLTAHASKGLEFPIVFIINLVAGRFPTRNRSDPIEIPEQLIKELLPSGNAHIQEERRLLYVGITRAKKYLYLTYAKNYGGKKEKIPSGFLGETGIKTEQHKFDENRNTQTGLFGVESGYRTAPQKTLEFTPKFLSYSQINTYNTCPLQYKYSYILNIPTKPSHALSFGITIHDTLRDFHRKLLFGRVSFNELLEMYDKNWQPLGYLNEEHRNLSYEEGKKLLKTYYEKNKDIKEKPIELEKSFKLNIDGIKFYGRIDRIDKLPGAGVEIIDYKTGSAKTQKEVDMDDQVAFYAIAAKEALNLEPKKLTYYFVQQDQKISTTRSPEQLQKEKQKAKSTIEKIKSGNFEATPGMICKWCDYKDICPNAWSE